MTPKEINKTLELFRESLTRKEKYYIWNNYCLHNDILDDMLYTNGLNYIRVMPDNHVIKSEAIEDLIVFSDDFVKFIYENIPND